MRYALCVMRRQQAKIRIEKLKKEISHYRYFYHVLDKSEISDAALDSLKMNWQNWKENILNLSRLILRRREWAANPWINLLKQSIHRP